MTSALLTTATLSCVTLLFVPVYWYLGALVSWNGPEDDIAIIYLLAIPILVHGYITSKHGLKAAAIAALAYFIFLSLLCTARHFEMSDRSGYSDRMASRCLESLAWSLPWFLVGLAFSVVRKSPTKIKQETEQGGDGDAEEAV